MIVIWILAALAVIVALINQRSARVRAGLVVVLLGMLAAGIYFRFQAPPAVDTRIDPTSPSQQLASIPPEDIQMSNFEMTGTGAPWRLTGTITNRSSRDLLSFTLAVTRQDCYAGALDASGCVTLWSGRQLVRLEVPAQATRNFTVDIWPSKGFALKGQTRDTFEITAALGR